jgi:hypothetical protein
MLAGLVIVSTLIGGACGSPEKKGTAGGDLVDCNYYWPKQYVHVCIKDMPKKECEDLFTVPFFDREKDCACSQPGRKAEQVKGMGYVQYNCK